MPIRILTLSGRSGCGKTTIERELIRRLPGIVVPVLSTTTRAQRPDDIPGDYEYMSDEEFDRLFNDGKFAWPANVGKDRYGTRQDVLNAAMMAAGRIGIMILTPDAVPMLKNATAHHAERGIHSYCVYLLSPAEPGALAARMIRSGRSPESASERVRLCADWDSKALASGNYDETFRSEEGALPRIIDTLEERIRIFLEPR